MKDYGPKSPSHTLLCLLGVVTMLLGLAWSAPPVSAQGARPDDRVPQSATTLSIVPASAHVAVGSTITVDIRIENVSNLDYLDVLVTFDPALLEVVDANPAQDGVQIAVGAFFVNPIVWSNSVEQGDIALTLQAASGAVTGSGVVATITFRGKGAGVSPVTIDEDRLVLQTPDEVDLYPLSVQNGSITVVSESVTSTPTSPTPTPTPEWLPTATPTFSSPTATPPPPTATPAGVVYSRVLQIWPDHSRGVASMPLEGPAPQAIALPFGVYRTGTGEIAQARTYLHFPLDVFPPGSEVLRATLHVHVDSKAGEGKAMFGVYRPLEPWDNRAWDNHVGNWPTLLTSPIALTTTFAFATTHSATARKPWLALSRTPYTSALLSGYEPAPGSASATPPASPLDTSPLPTPTLPSPTPTVSPTPSPQPAPEGTSAVVALQQTAGTWLTWDVTALARAWLRGEVADTGLALAAAPTPDAEPETAGNLLVARWPAADDPTTRPYLIAEIVVHPVTPTPRSTPAVLLPRAGSTGMGQFSGVAMSVAGAILLALGLALRGKRRV